MLYSSWIGSKGRCLLLQEGDTSPLNGGSLKSGSPTSEAAFRRLKVRSICAYRKRGLLSIGYGSHRKSDVSDEIKRSFFHAAVVLILLYEGTTLTPTKRIEKKTGRKLHKNASSNIEQFLKQHPTKQQLCGHLPPISKTIQIRRTRHAGHCWRFINELISDVVQWVAIHGCARVGWPKRTCLQQFCMDTWCSLEDPQEAMDKRERARERERERERESQRNPC